MASIVGHDPTTSRKGGLFRFTVEKAVNKADSRIETQFEHIRAGVSIVMQGIPGEEARS